MRPSPKLADWIDPARLAPIYRQHRRLHIPDFLDAAYAAQLGATLANDVDWSHTILVGGKGHDARLDALQTAPESVRREVETVVAETARTGFQFDFETWRLSDELEAGRRQDGRLAPLEALYDFLNGRMFLDFIRGLTGSTEAAYVDAQATRYGAGHFLNTHDDDAEGKERLFAYVLNLTPNWRTDWGGLLLFHDADGHVAEGYVPRFNALNIFSVPQPHSVSQVASFVTAHRYAVTGWVRRASARPRT